MRQQVYQDQFTQNGISCGKYQFLSKFCKFCKRKIQLVSQLSSLILFLDSLSIDQRHSHYIITVNFNSLYIIEKQPVRTIILSSLIDIE